jgi:hypothetical protein
MKHPYRFFASLLIFLSILSSAGRTALARVKLAALPERERVELQLDNGRYTLVEEERIVPLLESTAKRGNNRIDFSWSNTSIDKDSILLRPIAIRQNGEFRALRKIDGHDEIGVVNVSFPPNENALVWEVYAATSCAVKVRVSYLIHNLTRSFSYRAAANKDETFLTLRSFLELRNYSGEDYGSAGIWAGFGPKFSKEVGQQEQIKMLLRRFPRVPIDKTFTFDWYAHGKLNAEKPLASPILMHYRLTNDEKNGLGAFPLQPGKVRIFITDGRGGEAFLGEDIAGLTPLDGKMRLFLGQSRDIVCERIVEKNVRHVVQGNLFHQEVVLRYEIENFRDKACSLDLSEQIARVAAEYGRPTVGQPEWEMGELTSEAIAFTYENGRATPSMRVDLPARRRGEDADGQKITVRFHFTIKNLW